MSVAFVFPGQGSQSIGMLGSLAGISPIPEATFAEASEVLGYDLWQRCHAGPVEALNVTECTQPAMLSAGVATYRLWRERGGRMPEFMAGHSLGEVTAWVAAGCIEFKVAVALVKFRATAMQSAVPPGVGAMAAVLGLEDDLVEEVCRQVAADGRVVEAVNFNSPGQVVIAGESNAVARASDALTAKGARRVMPLSVSVPAHSSLMLPAAESLRVRLAGTPLSPPLGVSVYGVDVRTYTQPADIRHSMVKQLHTPVRWASTVRAMIAAGATRIVECGPGKILTALNRRIDKSGEVKMLALEDPKSVEEALAASVE